MTLGAEWKTILLFSLPLMAGNLLQQLYNIIDGIIVGRTVGQDAFAAVTTGQPLVFLYLALALGMSVGANIVVAQFFGAGRNEKLSVSIDTALILLGGLGILLTAFGIIFSGPLLRNVLNVHESVLQDATTYMSIFSIGLFFTFLYNSIAAILRGFGDSKAILYFLLISTILSTILTILFVPIFGWGVAGAAASTVIAQATCAVVSFIYLRKKIPYEKSGKHWDGKIAKTMARLGAPIAVQMAVLSVGNAAMWRLVNNFEATVPGVIAAYGAAIRLDMLIFVPIMGFQSGLASFVGQNMGAGKLDRVKRGFHSTIIMSLIVTVIMSAILYPFAPQIVGLFGLTDGALEIGATMVRFLMMFFWIFSIYITINGVLQGSGDTIMLSISTLSALTIRVLLGYLAVHFEILGHEAAWLPLPIGWAIALIISSVRYFTGGWRKKAIIGKRKPEEAKQLAD